MSWSVQRITGNSWPELEEALRASYAAFREYYQDVPEAIHAMDEQVDSAIGAARWIVSAGAVGDGPYVATMSGHANPHHARRGGWNNDTVNVLVAAL
jgi:hypothetical protein